MDITKYLKNKDIQVSNEDIDFEKLEKDIRKGYVSSDEVEKVRQEVRTEATSNYTALEDKYNKLEKSYNDIEARNTELTNNKRGLEQKVEMVSLGFKKEDLEEVSKLRNSVYESEEDDIKAFSAIKERYGSTFGFTTNEPETPKVPEEPSFNSNTKPKEEIKITRNSRIKDLVIFSFSI